MKLTYFGHSAVLVEKDGFKALIDPFITYNPHTDVTLDAFSGLSHIFVTHGHGDHLGDTLELAKMYDVTVITNFEIANYLRTLGVNSHGMHIGGRHTFEFGTVKMTPALHGSGIQTEDGTIDGGNPCGFVITIGGKTIYHAGDTGLTVDMTLLAEEEIDVAFLPIGGNFTMDIRDAVRAATFVEAKTVVPIHYNTFPIIEADPEKFVNLVKNAQVKVLSAGETLLVE
ncbi:MULTISPECIES: metal-dependent hydrolase [unclassified Fusibacter]|uniref:metal-dependent hydrolase n=1 Tax=unclassified Fusibacter TaxID=2624464 RepID=UPI001012DFD6|nr:MULTISPECIES: metal-dependent hydrolase [unclassified Fusibacter]MCK8060320.1 metal-dependent hydrolase [Fusibacter sp. A2]NPE20391.1 metal-dependent hydrolase [Fusibacter sp. A1]RXV63595.1 metal-dependent hydrolase [Fusibacter sp. A1]